MRRSFPLDWTLSERDGHPLWSFGVRIARSARMHRTTGHAAEMAFFAVLTLVPSTIAVGAALAATQHVLGPDIVHRADTRWSAP